ncbi:Os02g0668350, partial [Oryza sativa Japonica Group]
AIVRTHLCAWGNDAASEVIPRRVNCWLKTISKPPLRPIRASENFWKGSLTRVKPTILNLSLHLESYPKVNAILNSVL